VIGVVPEQYLLIRPAQGRLSKKQSQDAEMTEYLPLVTRRLALISGSATAAVMALPTTFNLAANAASTISNKGDTEMAYITT
jgi:hypothetical protein